jgi:hypothetical protein
MKRKINKNQGYETGKEEKKYHGTTTTNQYTNTMISY